MITSGRPTNLSSIVVMTLKSRFFEGIGLKTVGSLALIGDRSHAFSYTSWYKELNEKSAIYTTSYCNNSFKQSYASVVKYGILSKNNIITQKDHFEVSEVSTSVKHVKIRALSRSPLINFCKTWVSADATYSLDYETVQALFRGKLLNRNEFRTGDNTFVRNATGVYFDIVVNGLPALHLIETSSNRRGSKFNHIVLIESNAAILDVEFEDTKITHNHEWATSMKRSLESLSRLRPFYTYSLGKYHDTLTFIPINTSTTFDMDIQPFTITIALRSDNFVIPITHTNPKNVETLNLGYTLHAHHIINAVSVFSRLLDKSDELANLTDYDKAILNYIIYKTTIHSNFEEVKRKLEGASPFNSLRSRYELDVFKTLLLDDRAISKTVNPSRLYQYINNLFCSPAVKDNYLTSVTVEDKVSFALDENTDDIEEETEEIELQHEDFTTREAEDTLFEKDEDSSDGISLDLEGIQEFDDSLDDIDLDAISDDDEIDANEGLFETLDIGISDDTEDQITIQSSRTGLTVNPNNEFPYQILKYLKDWNSMNKLKQQIGIPREVTTIADLPKAFLLSYRLAGTTKIGLLKQFTGKEVIDLPCPLSDLAVIKAVHS